MAEHTSFAHGTPSWVDLATSDIDAAVAFYGGLFGWEAFSPGPPEETGGYQMFTKGGKLVAGVMPIQEAEAQPPSWTTYVNVDDAKATAAAAADSGGQVVMPAMEVGAAGSMAVIADPAGAVFGLWQPGEHKGAQVTQEPGTLTWNELMTRDPGAAKAFYGALFGWTPEDVPMEGTTYTLWKSDGLDMAGMMPMEGDMWPEDLPSHWMTYFATADADATVATATELGGRVSVPPTDVPGIGRFAVLNDPQGAFFSVLQGQSPEE